MCAQIIQDIEKRDLRDFAIKQDFLRNGERNIAYFVTNLILSILELKMKINVLVLRMNFVFHVK